jgi:hypothetical protein
MRYLGNLFRFTLNKPSYSQDIANIRQNWQKLITIQGEISFGLEIRRSRILDAGYGVICKGSIPANRLVALYPGQYYPPVPSYAVMTSTGEQSHAESNFLRHLNQTNDGSYQIHCNHRGGFIDGKDAPSLTAYCVGHLVNHPPRKIQPNVRPVDFRWDDVLASSDKSFNPSDLNPIGHGVWYIDPMTNHAVDLAHYSSPLVGLALLSTRAIKDEEELLLDYNYDTYTATPPWYHPVEY